MAKRSLLRQPGQAGHEGTHATSLRFLVRKICIVCRLIGIKYIIAFFSFLLALSFSPQVLHNFYFRRALILGPMVVYLQFLGTFFGWGKRGLKNIFLIYW